MCGLAGTVGIKLSNNEKNNLLKKMYNRGPDSQKFQNIFKNVNIFHSRLSIIDLKQRSNQPLTIGDCVIIYNGEIYNYLELKKKLISKGIKFKTESDTEVLLQMYKVYGLNFLSYLEGMWALCILDKKKNQLIISRDRFGEKPLYFFHKNNKFFFGSEISYFFNSNLFDPKINFKKIQDYLYFGYKSLNKSEKTFFKDIEIFPSSSIGIFDLSSGNFKIKKYWMPEINHEPLKTINKSKKIISDIREILIKSVKTRLRSDVETAFLLSGGIDSSSLVSIASNFLGRKINTFSLVDTDDRYNEKKEIDFTVKDTSCKNHIIEINKKDFFQKIENNINYYHEPLPTISAYIHNELIKNIKKNYPKTKVLIEGNCADEIFAGYYDHYLQHLKICKDVKIKKFNENLHFWKKYIKKNIRNKYFQMHDIYIKNENFRDHIYDGYFELKKLFIKNNNYSFKEAFFTDDLLKNRMMNELFYEASPVILNSTDRNCMMYSIENRNPFLDTNLINYLYSLPSILFIQKGYNKYLLREAMKGLLNENIRTNRQKKGFNASINSLIDFKSNEFIDFFNEKSIVDDYVNKKKLNKILKMKKMPNYMSKFIFNYVNTKIFLKKFN